MTTPSTVFEKISNLFQSTEQAVLIANRMDKAYAEGTGHPDWHAPFGLDSPQKVAQNLAGLYAADTFSHLVAYLRHGVVTESGYLEALELLVSGDLWVSGKYIAKNLANLAWRSGQPFLVEKDKTSLSRITRGINMPFALLPPDEEDKDLVQTREGAKILLEWVRS